MKPYFGKNCWEKPSETPRELAAAQRCIEPMIWEILPKTSASNIVARTSFRKLVPANFMLKLYFEKCHWRKPQKYRKGREHFVNCVPFYYYGSVSCCALWHANSFLPQSKCFRRVDWATKYLRILTTVLLTRPAMARKRWILLRID
jgi:hypothetical protein